MIGEQVELQDGLPWVQQATPKMEQRTRRGPKVWYIFAAVSH